MFLQVQRRAKRPSQRRRPRQCSGRRGRAIQNRSRAGHPGRSTLRVLQKSKSENSLRTAGRPGLPGSARRVRRSRELPSARSFLTIRSARHPPQKSCVVRRATQARDRAATKPTGHNARPPRPYREWGRCGRATSSTAPEASVVGQFPVTAASSTGRCNTIQCIDSTMLARENHLFGCTRQNLARAAFRLVWP
jgi:hypothetical protein